MVSLSLQFGNAPTSMIGYASHGLVLCAFLGEVETGYGFGKLALSLLSRFNLPELKCVTLHSFGTFIQHYQEAFLATTLTLKDAYTTGMEAGNFLRAGYSTVAYNNMRFFGGVELDICESELVTYSAALAQVKQYSPQIYLDMTWQTVKNLRETLSQPDCLISTAYEEAFANELGAKFYLDWGKQRIAQSYMIEAYYGYARWGAKAKVADLERHYPQLLAPILQQTRSLLSTSETILPLESVAFISSATSSSSSISDALDLKAILKTSQTISGEIELEKLLSSLLHIVIENAGADKCVLMLVESGNLLIRALAQHSSSVTSIEEKGSNKVHFSSMLLNPQSIEDSQDVPVGLINTVKRSLQPAVIVDARVQSQLINELYIQQQQPKSILCSPILHQGKLLGILYLENNAATGAFTSERVELLNLLCAQAAISLENARFYQRSQEYAQQLKQSLDELSASKSRFQRLVDNAGLARLKPY